MLCSCSEQSESLNYIDGIYKGISKVDPMYYIKDSTEHYTSSTGITILRLDNNTESSFPLNCDDEQLIDYFNAKIVPFVNDKVKLRLYLSTFIM